MEKISREAPSKEAAGDPQKPRNNSLPNTAAPMEAADKLQQPGNDAQPNLAAPKEAANDLQQPRQNPSPNVAAPKKAANDPHQPRQNPSPSTAAPMEAADNMQQPKQHSPQNAAAPVERPFCWLEKNDGPPSHLGLSNSLKQRTYYSGFIKVSSVSFKDSCISRQPPSAELASYSSSGRHLEPYLFVRLKAWQTRF